MLLGSLSLIGKFVLPWYEKRTLVTYLSKTFRLTWDCGVALKNQPLDRLMGCSGRANLSPGGALWHEAEELPDCSAFQPSCSLCLGQGFGGADVPCGEPSLFPCSRPSYTGCHQMAGETTSEEWIRLPTWMGYPRVAVGDADVF